MRWSGEPTIRLRFFDQTGALVEHRFYHAPVSAFALARQQHYEYERGFPAWLTYEAPS